MMQWQALDQSLHQVMAEAENRLLARSILGTDEVALICLLLQTFCQSQLGEPIAQCGLSYLSVGATFVIRLTNGNLRVIKAHGIDQDLTALQASAQVQAALSQEGFPCPQVLLLPQRWQSTILAVYAYVDAGDRIDGFAPTVRVAMAHQLANLMQRTQRYTQRHSHSTALPLWMPWFQDKSVLWPRPHNVLFNFEQTSTSAEWIDAIARTAQTILLEADGKPAIGHSDWSVQNMAFRGTQLTCVYDWDSLRVGQEAFFVGGAARCFAHDWRFAGPERSITLAEALSFVREYEAVRGQPFTATEQRTIGAAIVYTAAYGTRCAHPGNKPETAHSQRTKQQLREFAAYFLN